MIREISSSDNKIFKEYTKLSQKKYRDKMGVYLIEGVNLIEEAKKNGAQVDSVVVRKGMDFDPSFDCIYVLEPKLYDKIAQTETSQGIMAVVKKRKFKTAQLKEIISESNNFVVLDRLQDPGNIGTIIRTADGAGYGAVIAVKGTADVYSPKVIRAAAGSVFRIPIILVENNRELRELVDEFNKELVVTCFDTDNYYFDVDISKGVALVIGNEGNGVSDELMDMADIKVKIPMNGNLESLNASVAAGILMYEAMRGN